MKSYTVTIEETVTKSFAVSAESPEAALACAERRYREGDFVLDPGEVTDRQISVCGGEGERIDWHSF